MKFAIHTAVLLLVLGTTATAFAQKDGKGNSDGAKPAQQDRQAAKPAQQHTQRARPAPQQHAQQTRIAPQSQQHAQQASPAQRQQVQRDRPAQQQHAQQTPVRNGNGGGAHGRISDAHYRASFGRSHSFHVNQGEFNNHRFQYGGYWFGFGAPWPAGWLYTDDVYVEYIDGGYYMFDPYHPGIRLSIDIM